MDQKIALIESNLLNGCVFSDKSESNSLSLLHYVCLSLSLSFSLLPHFISLSFHASVFERVLSISVSVCLPSSFFSLPLFQLLSDHFNMSLSPHFLLPLSLFHHVASREEKSSATYQYNTRHIRYRIDTG